MENDKNKKDDDQTFYFWFGSAFVIITAIILTVHELKPEGFQGIETIFYFLLGTAISSFILYIIAMLPGAIVHATANNFSVSQIFTGIAFALLCFLLLYNSNPSKYQFVTKEKYDALVQDYQEAYDEAYYFKKESDTNYERIEDLDFEIDGYLNDAFYMYEFLKSKGYDLSDELINDYED